MTVENSMKNCTVGALLLQTAILAGSTFHSYRGSRTSWDFGRGALMATAYFGALFLVAVYLTFHHYSYTVKKSTLQLWGIFCILLGIIPLWVGLYGIIFSPSFSQLYHLFSVLLGITPPILIVVFSSKEKSVMPDED